MSYFEKCQWYKSVLWTSVMLSGL